ncbi:MAG: hypothetical protein C4530_12555 [Desulfobacteraceae bacterium]|nr:MAG: hypothetical protein C4530_12555 [Desulfobacteraceae bacterium]
MAIPDPNYRRSLLTFLLCLILIQAAIIYAIDLKRPIYGDEVHFVPTVVLFGENPTIHTLKHYPEMVTPLSFIVYGLWGRVFGFELHILRVLSIVIALAAYILLHRFFFAVSKHSTLSVLTAVFIALNPYMVGLNVFVYTDMLGILCMIAACLAVYHDRALLFMISSAGMLLSRQYLIFLTAAALLFYLILYINDRRPAAMKMMLAGMASMIPFLCLVILWRGLGPDNEIRRINLTAGFSYHPSFVTLYVSQMFMYLLPLVVACLQSFKDKFLLGSAMLLSPFYWLFPVRPSKVLVDADIQTVGFLHRTLGYLFHNILFEDIAFFLMFCFGLTILLHFIRDAWTRFKQNRFDYAFFLYLSIFIFLLIQPISYVSWEKYFMPVMPLGAIQILRPRFNRPVPLE